MTLHLHLIKAVWVMRIILEVVGASALLFSGYVIIGAKIDGILAARRRRARQVPR